MVTFRRRAFALADIVVATVIIGASLAVIVGLTSRAVSSQTTGQDLSTAAHLADEQLNLVLSRGPDDYAKQFPISGPCEPPFERFSYELTFAGGSGPADPFRVTANISWPIASASGPKRSIAVSTLMATRTGAPDGNINPDRTPPQSIIRTPNTTTTAP